jgi:hypothetical protein
MSAPRAARRTAVVDARNWARRTTAASTASKTSGIGWGIFIVPVSAEIPADIRLRQKNLLRNVNPAILTMALTTAAG